MILYMLTVLVRILNRMDGYAAIVYGYYTCILCKKYQPYTFFQDGQRMLRRIFGIHLMIINVHLQAWNSPECLHLRGGKAWGRKFYSLVLKSQSNEEARKVVEVPYNTTSDEVGKIIERARNEIEVAMETTYSTTQHTLQVTT